MEMYRYSLVSKKGISGFIYTVEPLIISVLNVELQYKITNAQIIGAEKIDDFTDEMGAEEAKYLAEGF